MSVWHTLNHFVMNIGQAVLEKWSLLTRHSWLPNDSLL